jgi:biotin carboxylase
VSSLLAVIGQVPRVFREYALRGARQVAELWLLTSSPERWHLDYCASVTQIDLDGSEALEQVSSLVRDKVAGVVTFDERYVELTARLAAALGCAGASPDAVHRFKDKSRLRALTKDRPYGVRFGVAKNTDQAERVAEALGYPVVAKPRALGGSIGVVKASSPKELAEAFSLATEAKVGDLGSAYEGVLIEEYVNGPEVSVDSSVRGGVTEVHFIADKVLGPEPHFEEFGHVVPTQRDCDREVITATVEDIHAVAGFDNGVSHIELRLTGLGPKLIEANARLGGDLIPYLGWLATGVDLARLAAEIAVGVPSLKQDRRARTAAVRFLYPDEPMELSEIVWSPPPPISGVEVEFGKLLPAGSRVAPPPDSFLSRPAYVLAHGVEPDAVIAAAATAANAVKLVGTRV